MNDLEQKIINILSQSIVPLYPEQVEDQLDDHEIDSTMIAAEMMWMADNGRLIRTKRKKYAIPEKMGFIPGTIQAHQKGYGFLICDDKEEEDVFIPAQNLKGAMHKDVVLVRLVEGTRGRKNSREGEVVKILTRANKTIIGTYESEEGAGFVVPDDKRLAQDIYIPPKRDHGAKDGDKVIVSIFKWPQRRRNAEGEVTEVLGRIGDPGLDILCIIKQFQLPEKFDDAVINQAIKVSKSGIQSGKGQVDRVDIRNLKMVTIDGADAKDLDDAVSIERILKGYRLGVHIADVSHYVTENSPLDKAAYERGTSVYLIDRVIPMLPKQLSNDICSLNPAEDRLALSVFMDVSRKGKVVDYTIQKSIICVNERMTYSDVTQILEDEPVELMLRYKELIDDFRMMQELASILQKKRTIRGSIDFDFEECKIELDANGKPVDIKPYDRGVSNRIIEEFMLLCNETVAEHIFWTELPFVYRIHEDPSLEKMDALIEFLNHLGYTVRKGNQLKSSDFQRILNQSEGKPEEQVIANVMLRSMQKARYSAANHGHFGLAAEYYCHFTSPIRRYPDLMIHRIIKQSIEGKISNEWVKKLERELSEIADHCSETERNAQEAERMVDDIKKAEYMQSYIGDSFEGIISGITGWGMYVELPNTVEGMIRLSTMDDDYYYFDEKRYCLIGERTKRIWRLGDKITITVQNVRVQDRIIDFVIDEKKSSNA